MQEVLVVRVSVLNDSYHDVKVNKEFLPLFPDLVVKPGRTNIRFPITSQYYKQLVSDCEKRYPQLNFHSAGQSIEEV